MTLIVLEFRTMVCAYQLALLYCKRWEAGREPGNEATYQYVETADFWNQTVIWNYIELKWNGHVAWM